MDIELPSFAPHPLLATPQLMTVAGALSRPRLDELAYAAERRVVRVDERTRVRVHVDRPRGRPRGAALVLAHGLTGSADSVYMLGTAAKAVERGFLVARVNLRNCGGTEELTRASYHGGVTSDFRATAEALVASGEAARVHLVGFSMGGNGVLMQAADWGAAPPAWIRSVATLSPCVDFDRAAEALQLGAFGRWLQRRFLRDLGGILVRRRELFPDAARLLESPATIRAFDDHYTAPLSGFQGVEDYYARASAAGRFPEIRLPTLVLTARDDPLVPFDSFRHEEIASNPCVRLEAPAHGGHVAFVARRPALGPDGHDPDRRWAENRLVQWALAHDV